MFDSDSRSISGNTNVINFRRNESEEFQSSIESIYSTFESNNEDMDCAMGRIESAGREFLPVLEDKRKPTMPVSKLRILKV